MRGDGVYFSGAVLKITKKTKFGGGGGSGTFQNNNEG